MTKMPHLLAIVTLAAVAWLAFGVTKDLSAQQPVNVSQVGGATPIVARCDDPAKVTTVAISTAASGSTQLVALAANQIVYACGYNFIAEGTVNVKFIYGTGAACVTGATDLTGAYPLVANSGIAVPNTGVGVQFKGAVSNAVCINLSGAIGVRGLFTYVKE